MATSSSMASWCTAASAAVVTLPVSAASQARAAWASAAAEVGPLQPIVPTATVTASR